MVRSVIFNNLRIITPHRLRAWLKARAWFTPLSRVLFGNAVYCESYYNDVERLEQESTPHIARWIKKTLNPGRVIDIGCGPGHLIKDLAANGIDVFGVDLSDAALAATRAKGLKCQRFDLTAPNEKLPGTPYDLAISCEVAEHLAEKYAVTFVKHLCTAASTVFLTAAEVDPSMGIGLFHVNERPHQYWIDLFSAEGFGFDAAASEDARQVFTAANVTAYLAKPLIFRKKPVSA